MSPAAPTLPILRRFPSHLGAGQPGKLVGAVVDALAGELEIATTEVGRVRRSRRLAEAAELADLLLLAGLHAIAGHAVELLRQRLAAAKVTEYDTMLALLRTHVQTVVALHGRGNGSVGALLGASANAVALDVDRIRHSSDRYWHVADCTDRVVAGGEIIVLEENPLKREVFAKALRHGEQLTVPRRGYEDAPVTIRVRAVEDRTVAPMVVNVDTGAGLAYTGALTKGQTLTYDADGGVSIPAVDGVPVSEDCYWFSGGVFADAAGPYFADFVFADDDEAAPGHENIARFAVSNPPGAFAQDDPLPARDPANLRALEMPAGSARWTLFVGAGTFGIDADADTVLVASPHLFAARFDRSVFDPLEEPPSPQPVGELELSWVEHRPFEVIVWIPKRFAALDGSDPPLVVDRVASLIDRHSPAGVNVDVLYVDDVLMGRLPADLRKPIAA